MGRQALLSHCSGKKHQEIDIKVKTFFSKPKKTDLKENKKKSDSSEPTVESKKDKNDSLPKIQPTIEIVIQNAEHSKAEIKWALKSMQVVRTIVAMILLICFETSSHAKIQNCFNWAQQSSKI